MILRTGFNAPSVDEVDPSTMLRTGLSAYTGAAGDEIAIMASDDFDVLGVQVALTDGESNPIESSAALETPADSGRWVYTATAAVETGTTVRPSTGSGQASRSQPKTVPVGSVQGKRRNRFKPITWGRAISIFMPRAALPQRIGMICARRSTPPRRCAR
ncbi:MAG: hypothetical protein U9Q82_00450 [Chloroflexota bacterium]|nr:hypothetical protein [Chloroflexota bacterium]